MRGEGDRHIGEQAQRRAFERRGVTRIAHERFEQNAYRAERCGIEQHGTSDQQPEGRTHGAEVCPEIDHIGDEQQENDAAQEPR